MTRKYWLTAGTALALGLAWTAGPALAQQTTGEKIDKKVERAEDKAERAKDKADAKADEAKAKAERTKNKAEMKAEEAKAKADAKAEKAKDKAEGKTESTMDHAKDKARDVKDKVKDKTSEVTHKAADKTARANASYDRQEVMAMQRSLREKGFDPGPADGVIGPRTHAALLDYQKKENLTPNGRWDDDTKSRLGVTAMTAPDKTAVSASPADPRGEKPAATTPPPTRRNAP